MTILGAVIAMVSFSGVTSSATEWRPAEPNEEVQFVVLLKQRNLAALTQRFQESTTPETKNYRRWLSTSEVADLVAPPLEARSRAALWLRQGGARCDVRTDSLHCVAVAHDADVLLGAQFVRCIGSSCPHTRAMSAVTKVPPELSGVVDFVDAGQYEPQHVKAQISTARVPTASEEANSKGSSGDGPSGQDFTFAVVPEFLRTLYNASAATGASGSRQAAVEFPSYDLPDETLSFDPPTLTQWSKDVAVPLVSVMNTSALMGNETCKTKQHRSCSMEASLDVQQLGSIGQGNTNWYYQQPKWLLSLFSELAEAADVPQVLSVSYGTEESMPCKHPNAQCIGLSPKQYVDRVNVELQKLGLRGVSVIVASGDHGALCVPNGNCLPSFPATSPFVTAVGGTMMAGAHAASSFHAPVCNQGGKHESNCVDGGSEVVWSFQWSDKVLGTSAGGFSNMSLRATDASWQDAAVSAYISKMKTNGGYGNTLPLQGTWNESGRAIPDISANAFNFYTGLLDESSHLVVGTSGSAPVVAGLVALANANRIAAGKPVLGPLNALLYKLAASHPDAFQDVTIGHNKCVVPGHCENGFTATKGWDAATGLGSLNWGKFVSAVDALDQHSMTSDLSEVLV